MNEKIQHIIQDIRTKKDAMTGVLSQLKQKINQLEQEVIQLKSEVTQKETENNQLKNDTKLLIDDKNILSNEIAELTKTLEEAKNQAIKNVGNANGQQQIDELVREIEYCIGQLKK